MKHKLISLLTLGLLCMAPFVSTEKLVADEGMWLPVLIQRQILDMQKLGCRLSAEDIYSVNQACLKDAIVQFGGGCTGEMISDKGLLITNHHCGYGSIQAHSSVAHDYLKDGFWASSQAQELPNKGLTVTFLRRMDDVTAIVLDGVTDTMTEAERTVLIQEHCAKLEENAAKEGVAYRGRVAPLYYGNQYFLYVFQTFSDVRLVAAPPSSIGKFGGDTDNWMWPRHTGDFSMFRVYANADNQPAAYDPNNVPYHPKKHFTISTKGVKEGDFTMVYGFPGRTQEYVLSPAVAYIANVSNPHKIHLRTLRLDIMNAYQAKDQSVRIQYSSKNAGVSNAWKKWQGEAKGIIRLGTVAKKEAYEQRFQAWAEAGNRAEYINLLPRMKDLYARLNPKLFAAETHSETIMAVEILRFAYSLQNIVARGQMEQAKSYATSFFKDYYLPIDKATFIVLLKEYFKAIPINERPLLAHHQHQSFRMDFEAWADDLFTNSAFASQEKTLQLLQLPEAEALEAIQNDPATRMVSSFETKYEHQIRPIVAQLSDSLTLLYRTWMKGIMEFDKERNFFPDANSTLRVSYGTVQGYKPVDGITYLPVSTLEGIMQKDNPAIFDYNIPQSLRDIYAQKAYGKWGYEGSVPVCFLATNHTSGGNSGSPILNANGELLGLNFDRVWEGTMSDIEFDPTLCRNISVDIRYVLFVIDRIGNASYLFEEMDIL